MDLLLDPESRYARAIESERRSGMDGADPHPRQRCSCAAYLRRRISHPRSPLGLTRSLRERGQVAKNLWSQARRVGAVVSVRLSGKMRMDLRRGEVGLEGLGARWHMARGSWGLWTDAAEAGTLVDGRGTLSPGGRRGLG